MCCIVSYLWGTTQQGGAEGSTTHPWSCQRLNCSATAHGTVWHKALHAHNWRKPWKGLHGQFVETASGQSPGQPPPSDPALSGRVGLGDRQRCPQPQPSSDLPWGTSGLSGGTHPGDASLCLPVSRTTGSHWRRGPAGEEEMSRHLQACHRPTISVSATLTSPLSQRQIPR